MTRLLERENDLPAVMRFVRNQVAQKRGRVRFEPFCLSE